MLISVEYNSVQIYSYIQGYLGIGKYPISTQSQLQWTGISDYLGSDK